MLFFLFWRVRGVTSPGSMLKPMQFVQSTPSSFLCETPSKLEFKRPQSQLSNFCLTHLYLGKCIHNPRKAV